MKFKNKRAAGEIGQTIIWVVATLIIFAMLIISVFATTALGKLKQVNNLVNALGNPISSTVYDFDLFAEKSFESFLFTKFNSETAYQQIKNEGNLNDANGNLAKNIFPKLYEMTYKSIWVGVLIKPNHIINNLYFPTRSVRECPLGFSQEIKLNAEKYLLLTLTGCSN